MSNQGDLAIITNPAECRRCLTCQLVCSLSYDKMFNPAKAKIRIGMPVKRGTEYITEISFTDDCNGCGLCTKYCLYGALTRRKKP